MNKNTQLTMFSSKTGNWATPVEFFKKLDWRFGPFDLDPAQILVTLNAQTFLQRPRMVFQKAGKGLLALLTRPMAVGLRTGSRRLMTRLAVRAPAWLC